MSSVVDRAAARLRPRDRSDGYVLCPEDRFWFQPRYTDGKCPLCGAVALGGAPPPPLLVRFDRSWLGVAAFTLVSLVMSALVLVAYFKA